MQWPAFSVGLTGGIGSGKSTVADMFAALGASLIDTDVIAHQLTAADGAALPAIRAQFGETFISQNGGMNRAAMREKIFTDPGAKRQLEAILHPLIRQQAASAAAQANGAYVLFVVPLLIESANWRQQVTRTLVIDCPEALQIQRVMQRNKLSKEQVQAIIAAQVSREARRTAADDVLVNDGAPASLLPHVARLHALYLTLASSSKESLAR